MYFFYYNNRLFIYLIGISVFNRDYFGWFDFFNCNFVVVTIEEIKYHLITNIEELYYILLQYIILK